jgi:hypothetical protein
MSRWIRQTHRWLALAFTAGAIVNFFTWKQPAPPAAWITAMALVPLALLLLSGLYLFVLPHVRRGRAEPAS